MGKEATGVRAKLAAYKDENSGSREVTLNLSGVVCTVPKFINHGRWMAAQKAGKGDVPKTQAAFVCETVLFEGEKLTEADLRELVPSGDVLQLINDVFGGEDGDDKDDEGNGAATVQ